MNKELINTANNFYLQGDYASARSYYEQAVSNDQTDIQALHNLGLTCYNLGDYETAEWAHNKACELGYYDSLVCRGNAKRGQRKFEDALRDYAQAVTLNPNDANAFNNYGNTLREMGRPRQAVPFLQAAQVLDPNNITAFFNESVAHLLAGDLERGWDAYEVRWKYESQRDGKPKFGDIPEWAGEDLQGRTILVYGEQGYGDAIQFVRYVKDLEAQGAKVIIAVREPLVELFKRMDTRATVISNETTELPAFDYHIPILSLPRVFKTTLATIPVHAGYIRPDQLLFQQWRKDLGLKRKMRVGICWSGNRSTWINRYKGMSLDEMLTIVDDEHEFICLQADATPEELAKLEAAGVRVFNDRLTDFNQTAALIAGLDVVVSVDTAVAHLSGALGVDTWLVLNSYGTDWRWLLGRNTNPWYPSIRVYRQTDHNSWTDCLDLVKKRLKLVKI